MAKIPGSAHVYEGDLVTGDIAISIRSRKCLCGINKLLKLRLFWNDSPLYGKFMVAHLRNNFDHTFPRSSRSVAWQNLVFCLLLSAISLRRFFRIPTTYMFRLTKLK